MCRPETQYPSRKSTKLARKSLRHGGREAVRRLQVFAVILVGAKVEPTISVPMSAYFLTKGHFAGIGSNNEGVG